MVDCTHWGAPRQLGAAARQEWNKILEFPMETGQIQITETVNVQIFVQVGVDGSY